MPRFLSGHLCPEISGSFRDRCLAHLLSGGEAAVLPLSVMGPAASRASLKVAGRQPDCGCQLAALAWGRRSRALSWGAGPLCPSGVTCREEIELYIFRNPTKPRCRRGEWPAVPRGPLGRWLCVACSVPGWPAEPGLVAVQCLLWAVAMPHAGVSVERPRDRCGWGQ